jgi:hypothetical protein
MLSVEQSINTISSYVNGLIKYKSIGDYFFKIRGFDYRCLGKEFAELLTKKVGGELVYLDGNSVEILMENDGGTIIVCYEPDYNDDKYLEYIEFSITRRKN